MDEAAFVHETDITTTPQRLWTALTSGALTRFYWFDRRVESDWRVGSPVTFHDGGSDVVTGAGEILESTPVSRLSYTLRQEPASGGAPDQPYSRVGFELTPLDGGRMRLRLVHDELAGPDDVADWGARWTPVLANLRAFLEGERLPVTEPPWGLRPVAAAPTTVAAITSTVPPTPVRAHA